MTKEEFEKLMKEEQKKGTPISGTAISRRDLIKMLVYLQKAAQVIDRIGKKAGKEDKDLDLVADCMAAGDGIDMVMDKILMPMMDQIERIDAAQEEE